LFKYDSTHGHFKGDVHGHEGKLVIEGQEIRIFAEKDATKIAWKDAGADFIVESTGIYTKASQAQAHLQGGAKKVIITAPSEDAPISLWESMKISTILQLNILFPMHHVQPTAWLLWQRSLMILLESLKV